MNKVKEFVKCISPNVWVISTIIGIFSGILSGNLAMIMKQRADLTDVNIEMAENVADMRQEIATQGTDITWIKQTLQGVKEISLYVPKTR